MMSFRYPGMTHPSNTKGSFPESLNIVTARGYQTKKKTAAPGRTAGGHSKVNTPALSHSPGTQATGSWNAVGEAHGQVTGRSRSILSNPNGTRSPRPLADSTRHGAGGADSPRIRRSLARRRFLEIEEAAAMSWCNHLEIHPACELFPTCPKRG